MTKEPEQYIQECQEWIARRKAWVDQMEKQFNDQYPFWNARINRRHYDDLEAWKLEIEVHEYELGGFIKDYIDGLEEE